MNDPYTYLKKKVTQVAFQNVVPDFSFKQAYYILLEQ